jgi:hypothetical protein
VTESNSKNDLRAVIVAIGLIAGLGTATTVAAYLAILPCITSGASNCDLANWQTLLLEGVVFVAGAGIIFYYFQRKNSLRTEQIIDSIAMRDKARKQFWVNVALARLKGLKSNHEYVADCHQKILANKMTIEERAEMSQTIDGCYYEAKYELVPNLLLALSQIGDLLTDSALISDLTADRLDEDVKSRFYWLLESPDASMTSTNIASRIETLNAKNKEIQDFIRRVENEMGSE